MRSFSNPLRKRLFSDFLSRRRVRAAVVVGVLAGAAVVPVIQPSAASAATPPGCLPDGTCVSISYTGQAGDLPYDDINPSPPWMGLDWHVEVSSGTLTTATFTTHDDPSMTSIPTVAEVVVNGSYAPSGAVQITGGNLTIDLGWLMPISAGHGIDISYLSTGWPLTTTLRSTVALTFDDAAHAGPATAVSPPAIWHAELPDMALSTARTALSIPRGSSGALAVSTSNHNPKAWPFGGLLWLDFPPGFDLRPSVAGPDEYVPSTCQRTGVGHWECGRPHSGGEFSAVLTIAAAAGLRPGSSGLLRLRVGSISPLRPVDADANPADNTRYVRLTALGLADLRIQVQPGGTPQAGTPESVTVRVSNAGPDLATGITASVTVNQPGLVVIGVDGRRWQPGQTSQRLPLSQLAAGRTARFTITLLGGAVGTTATVSASATSQSYDAGGAAGLVHLRFLSAGQPAALPPAGSLPATGAPIETPVLLGLILVALGLLLTVRRRAVAGDRERR